MYNYIFMKNIPIIIFPIITFKCIHIYYDWLILLVSWLSCLTCLPLILFHLHIFHMTYTWALIFLLWI